MPKKTMIVIVAFVAICFVGIVIFLLNDTGNPQPVQNEPSANVTLDMQDQRTRELAARYQEFIALSQQHEETLRPQIQQFQAGELEEVDDPEVQAKLEEILEVLIEYRPQELEEQGLVEFTMAMFQTYEMFNPSGVNYLQVNETGDPEKDAEQIAQALEKTEEGPKEIATIPIVIS